MTNLKITPKTYTWLKPLVTISSFCLLINPLIIFMKVMKGDSYFIDSWSTLNVIAPILYVIAGVCLGIYLWSRLNLQKASKYQQTSKDRKLLMISFGLYALGLVTSLIYLIVALNLKDSKTQASISFGILYSLVIVGQIGGAILETISRIPEQLFLAREQELEIRKSKIAQREAILANEVSEEEIVQSIKRQRTSEAQAFMKKDKTNPSEVVENNQELETDFNPFA